MISVKDMLQLPEMCEFELIAGKDGIKRQIRNIGCLDYEEYEELKEAFDDGDFVVTSLPRFHDNQEEATKYLLEMIRIRVCGIAIKNVFYSDVEPIVKKMADENSVPLFFYGTAVNSEDVIVAVKNSMRYVEKYFEIEKVLSTKFDPPENSEEEERFNGTVREGLKGSIGTVVLKYKKHIETVNIIRQIQDYQYKFYTLLAIPNIRFHYYNHSIIVLVTQSETREIKRIEDVLEMLYISNENLDFHIGYDLEFKVNTTVAAVIQNAINASVVCELQNHKKLSSKALGIYSQILPLRRDSPQLVHAIRTIEILKQHDMNNGTEFLITANCLVEHKGEVAACAQAMEIHKNTVRYRLKCIKELLYLREEESEYFYEQLFWDVSTYNIYQTQL